MEKDYFENVIVFSAKEIMKDLMERLEGEEYIHPACFFFVNTGSTPKQVVIEPLHPDRANWVHQMKYLKSNIENEGQVEACLVLHEGRGIQVDPNNAADQYFIIQEYYKKYGTLEGCPIEPKDVLTGWLMAPTCQYAAMISSEISIDRNFKKLKVDVLDTNDCKGTLVDEFNEVFKSDYPVGEA